MIIKSTCIVVLDDANFDVILRAVDNKLFIVDFWAEWCAPCKVFSSIFEEIFNEYNERVQFGKFNIDGNPLIVKKYNIRSIPTVLLFKSTVMIANKIGMLSGKQLKEFLDSNLEIPISKK